MSDDRKEIEKIQQELKQLSQRQVELSKTHQQQFFLYRWLQGPDPELQSVNNEIEDLKEQRLAYFKILQNAASVPPPLAEKDWSHFRFYSKYLAELGIVTPAEQMSAVSGGIFALLYAGSNFYRSHHLFRLTACTPGTKEWTYHWARSRATPEQIKVASYWIDTFRFRGFAALGAPFSLYLVYMWSKRKQ